MEKSYLELLKDEAKAQVEKKKTTPVQDKKDIKDQPKHDTKK
jgi:hypothetical protein